jgi:hypothetical protein
VKRSRFLDIEQGSGYLYRYLGRVGTGVATEHVLMLGSRPESDSLGVGGRIPYRFHCRFDGRFGDRCTVGPNIGRNRRHLKLRPSSGGSGAAAGTSFEGNSGTGRGGV